MEYLDSRVLYGMEYNVDLGWQYDAQVVKLDNELLLRYQTVLNETMSSLSVGFGCSASVSIAGGRADRSEGLFELCHQHRFA